MRANSFYNKYIKRLLDILLSLCAIIVLSPVYLVLWILVAAKLGRPVLFRQERPGLNEKLFPMRKFRSMTSETDSQGNLLPDEVRLTSFGAKLRDTSMDELPELFSILRGEMSIVGPRPQLVRDMVFMTDEQRRRHLVRPGLTGLAQVRGRNNISWEDKLAYDLEYMDNISFIYDLKIIFMTVASVLRREDVATDGMATAEDLGDYLLRMGHVDKETYDLKQQEARDIIEAYRAGNL